MAEYDLVIRNTTIATAADVVKGDIGISAGRVVALGERLDKGRKEIDATGLIAVPGGIDAHVHFDQDTADGSVFCDDFESGSRAAAAGGTTTIIPFAYQSKGQPLRDAVNKYHKRAEGKALIDYAFHVILSDASEKIMGQDFPALVADGYTSFKVYMTYDDVKLSDREMLDALAAARREQAMLMIHAENSDCITWLTERLEWKGMTAAKFHATSRPFVVEREATPIVRREALEALAIHFEHRARNLSEAHRFARLSLAERIGTRSMGASRHRLARLDRKLAKLPGPYESGRLWQEAEGY